MLELLKTVPPEAWAGLAGVLIGAILSIFGTWLSAKSSIKQLKIQLEFEKQKSNSEQNKSRLEEVYSSINSWANALCGNYITLTSVMDGHMTYNQHLDSITESLNKIDYDFGRLEMIVKVYGADFHDEYNKTQQLRVKLNAIGQSFRNDYLIDTNAGKKYKGTFFDAQREFEKSIGVLLNKVATSARNA